VRVVRGLRQKRQVARPAQDGLVHFHVVVQVVFEYRGVAETRVAQLANRARRQHGLAISEVTVDVLDERRLVFGRLGAVRTRLLDCRRRTCSGVCRRFPVRAAAVIRPRLRRRLVEIDEGFVFAIVCAATVADDETVSFDVRLERKLGAEKLAALVAQVFAHVADHVDMRAGLVQVERADLDELPGAHGAVEHLGWLLILVGRRGGLTVRYFPVVRQSPRSLELHGAMFAHVCLHVGWVFQSPVQAKVRVVQAHLGAVFAREKLRYFESVGLNGRGARGLHIYAVRQLVRGQSGVSAERGRTHHADERLVPVDGSSARVRRVPVSVQVHRVQVRGVAVLALDY